MSSNRTSVRGRTKVVIALNDPATRAGIRVALASDGILIAAEASSVHELVAAVGRHKPDVCLVAVDLRGDGIGSVTEIAATAPAVRVVLLTDQEDVDEFLEAMSVGASGYLEKTI